MKNKKKQKPIDKTTKKYAQMVHSQRRAKERYNLDLSDNDYKTLCEIINKNKQDKYNAVVKTIKHNSRRTNIKDIIFKQTGKQIRVVYDKSRHSIVTFLPLDSETYDDEYDEINDKYYYEILI